MNLVSINVGDYTRQGIERMSKVIRASLYARGWTERRLTAEIQARADELKQPELRLSTGTVNRYASSPPVIKRPQADVLRAIAPFVFKVVAINGDDIQLDLDHTYEADWREFARIGTTDFEKSATLRTLKTPSTKHNQTPGWDETMNLDEFGRGSGAVSRLIRAEMAARSLDPDKEEDFREFLSHFPVNDDGDVTAVRDVVQGRTAFVDDRIIGFLAKAMRTFTGNKRYTTQIFVDLNTADGTTNGHTHSSSGLSS